MPEKQVIPTKTESKHILREHISKVEKGYDQIGMQVYYTVILYPEEIKELKAVLNYIKHSNLTEGSSPFGM
jgi:hypothetical protein